jgi:hypothetical protein
MADSLAANRFCCNHGQTLQCVPAKTGQFAHARNDFASEPASAEQETAPRRFLASPFLTQTGELPDFAT